MAFKPGALNERTLKQFVDRLLGLRQKQSPPTSEQWPPKRSQIQEEIAAVLGFASWHAAIHAVRPEELADNDRTAATTATPKEQGQSEFGMYPMESARNTYKDFNEILVWASDQGASDITFSTGHEIIVERWGRMSRITTRKLETQEIEDMVRGLMGNESLAMPNQPMDLAHQVLDEKTKQWRRFRVNATAFTQNGHQGWQITCRANATYAPSLANIGAGDLAEHFNSGRRGLVLVSGQMGSGKTTLLSAIVKDIAANRGGAIVTYESPIEFVYSEINTRAIITQHTVGRDVRSYPDGVRNAVRRGPSTIMIGECRDNETIVEAVLAAMTGHTVLAGVNGWGVGDTVDRMIRTYENKEGHEVLELINSLSLVVSQILVPSTDGRRIALRETLVFDYDLIDRLLDIERRGVRAEINEILVERGQGFDDEAREKHRQGLISDRTLKEVERTVRSRNK